MRHVGDAFRATGADAAWFGAVDHATLAVGPDAGVEAVQLELSGERTALTRALLGG